MGDHRKDHDCLEAIRKRVDVAVKNLLKRFPKFIDTHAQPNSNEEFGALWSLDILYWIQDYCESLIDEEDY